jgi:hypothetical protein
MARRPAPPPTATVLATALAALVSACGTSTPTAPALATCAALGGVPAQRLVPHPVDGISGSWIVALVDGAGDLAGTAAGIAARHGGQVKALFSSLNGFALDIADARAPELLTEPAVCYVEQDAVVRASAVGTWQGTKTYVASDGSFLGAAGDWTFTVASDGAGGLVIAAGPHATVDASGAFKVAPFTYPAGFTPGPPGHCNPSTSAITDGAGYASIDGSLDLRIEWTTTCGGTSTASVSTYRMTRVDGLQPGQTSSL